MTPIREQFDKWAGIEYRNELEYTNRDHRMGRAAYEAGHRAATTELLKVLQEIYDLPAYRQDESSTIVRKAIDKYKTKD